MPPCRDPADITEIASLISAQLAEIIPGLVTQISSSIHGAGSLATNSNEGSYKNFMACKSVEFCGTKGAIELIRWIEKIENTLDIIKCPENQKVKFASCSFEKRALTWWISQLRARGRDAALAMTWAEFVELLKGEFCPKYELMKLENEFWGLKMEGAEHMAYTARFHELASLVPHTVTPLSMIDRYVGGLPPSVRVHVLIAQPTTLEDAIGLSATLFDVLVKNGLLTKKDSGKTKKLEYQQNKKQKVEKCYVMTAPLNQVDLAAQPSIQGNYVGKAPKCSKCQFHHYGKQCIHCTYCGKFGHWTKKCRIPCDTNNNNNAVVVAPATTNGGNNNNRACYECEDPNHFRNRCLKLNNNNNQVPRGRAFAIGATEACDDPTVTGHGLGSV